MGIYLLTFLINSNSVECFLVKKTKRQVKILFNDSIFDCENEQSIKNALIKLGHDVIQYNYCCAKKISCRLLFSQGMLDKQNFVKQKIKLPIAKWSQVELNDYIKVILAKKNTNTEQLIYDYTLADNHIELMTINSDFILNMRQAMSSFKCDFIGLPYLLINDLDIENCTTDQNKKMDIVNSCLINGANFLPWRAQKQALQRKQYFSIISSYLIVASLILFTWLYIIDRQLQQQLSINQTNNERLVEFNQNYAQLIELDKQHKLRNSQLDKDKITYGQLVTIVNYLKNLSLSMPDGTWLDSLEYNSNRVSLTGKSFRYSDILSLSEQLAITPDVATSKLINITQHQYLLRFEILNQLAINQGQSDALVIF